MTIYILPSSFPRVDPVAAERNADAHGAFPPSGFGNRKGFPQGYEERDRELMPFIDSLLLDLAEERRKTEAAETRAHQEQKAANEAYKQLVQCEALIAENGVDIPK